MAGNPDYGRKLFLEFCDSLETNVEEILKYGVNFQYEKLLKKPDIEEDPRLFEIEVRDFYRGEYFGKSEHHLQDGYGLRSEQEISINDVLKLVSRRDTQEIPAAFSKSKEFLHAIVVGPAGSGKTTFIKKLAKDVMLGKYDQESTAKKLVHVIECHNFNEEDTMTVPEFLFSNMHHKPSTTAIEEGYKRILQNSKCITFFVDSLDTLIYQLDDEKRIIGPYDTAPPATILYNIFIGSIFSESKVISSSREFKIRKYKNPLRPDRIIALGGLRRESIRKLVFGFLDEDEAIRVWEILVLECPDLMNLCEIPICLIFTLIGLIEKESSNIIPKTISGIMVRVLESLIHSEHAQAFGRHDEKYVITAIDKMKKLAFQGMKEGRVMFKENDLKQVNLSVEEITDLAIVVPGKSFQHQQILGGTDLVEFCHQTLQEMLAALHILKMNTSEFHEFVAEFLHKDLFIVVRRMLCGIVLNSEVWEAASEHLITENKDIDEIVEILNESLSDKFKEISNDRIDLLEVIRAIHEAGNGAKDIVPSHIESIHLGGAPLLISDFFALASSLFYCETLDELHLSTCRLTPDLLQHFSMRNLSSKCQVGLLDVSYNRIMQTDGLRSIGEFVKVHRVHSLMLKACDLTAKMLEALNEGLCNAKIHFLDVRGNAELKEIAMKILAEMVRDHEVKILSISGSNLAIGYGNVFANAVGSYKLSQLHNKTRIGAQYYEANPDHASAISEFFPAVSDIVNMTGWELNDEEQKIIQNQLGSIPESNLKVVFGKPENTKRFTNPTLKDQISDDEVDLDEESATEKFLSNDEDEIYLSVVRDILPSKETVVQLGGCEVVFPSNVVKTKTRVTLSLRGIPSKKLPQSFASISTGLDISHSTEFLSSITVKLRCWCVRTTTPVSDKTNVCVMHKLPDGSWDEIDDTPILKNRIIQFKTTKFSTVMGFINSMYYSVFTLPISGSVYVARRRLFVGIHVDDDNVKSSSQNSMVDMDGQCKVTLNPFHINYNDVVSILFTIPEKNKCETTLSIDPLIQSINVCDIIDNRKTLLYFKLLPSDCEFFSLKDVTIKVARNDEVLDKNGEYDFDYDWDGRKNKDQDASPSVGPKVNALSYGDGTTTTIKDSTVNITINS